MRTQSTAQHDSLLGVTPSIQARMPWRVVAVEVLPHFRLRVRFVDGTEGTVNLTTLIPSPGAGVFASLADPTLFAQAHVQCGAVTWRGEIGLAPDAMYAAIKKRNTYDVTRKGSRFARRCVFPSRHRHSGRCGHCP